MRGLGRRRIVAPNKRWYIPSNRNVSKILQEKVAVKRSRTSDIKLTAQSWDSSSCTKTAFS
jgi:hypothetical protein